jgi:hypothetical protein
MATVKDLAQECYRIKTQLEHDIRLFESGTLSIHHNERDVTSLTMDRMKRHIEEMHRLWSDLVAQAEIA